MSTQDQITSRAVFVAYFYFIEWTVLSLGAHISFGENKNIEIHLPFGFIRIGWVRVLVGSICIVHDHTRRAFGLNEDRFLRRMTYPEFIESQAEGGRSKS